MKYLISKASKERGCQEVITSALDSGQEAQIVTAVCFAWGRATDLAMLSRDSCI
jgi:hypothetical protein